MEQYVFQVRAPDAKRAGITEGQYLVTVFYDPTGKGSVELAFRAWSGDTWSPPVEGKVA